MTRFDAVLLLSFGGPEGPDDVLPFLENVTRGRAVPPERLAEVAAQYEQFGGVSPINEQHRALQRALRAELDRRGRAVPVAWGNRNWAPYVEDTLAELADAGHRRVLALATSAYSSYSSCRQYLEDIERARSHVAARSPGAVPEVVKVRPFWNHPGFVLATVDRVRSAIEQVPPDRLARTRLVFTAHSLPVAMARECDYEAQLHDVAALVSEALHLDLPCDVVFQSRSGPPEVPWLEPDIRDHLRALRDEGVDTVVVSPIGFVSDHMEVRFDLDTQAARVAAGLGITMVRAGTVSTHPVFLRGLGDLLDEYLVDAPTQAMGPLGPRVTPCAVGCCPAPRRPGRPS